MNTTEIIKRTLKIEEVRREVGHAYILQVLDLCDEYGAETIREQLRIQQGEDEEEGEEEDDYVSNRIAPNQVWSCADGSEAFYVRIRVIDPDSRTAKVRKCDSQGLYFKKDHKGSFVVSFDQLTKLVMDL